MFFLPFKKIADKLVFTGMIDEFFDYKFGPLEYRSVEFKTRVENVSNYQGVAVVNYTGKDVPFTRCIEHKHFEFGQQEKTVISEEYSREWQVGEEAYYPINDDKNEHTYELYKNLTKKEEDVIFGGRLGTYRYYDMDKIVSEALNEQANQQTSSIVNEI